MDRQKMFWHLSVEKEETLIRLNQAEAKKELALGHVLQSFLSYMSRDPYLSREVDLLLSQLLRYYIWQSIKYSGK